MIVRRLLAALLGSAILLAAGPASACLIILNPKVRYETDLAAAMVRRAATVDLVVAEAGRPIDYPSYLEPLVAARPAEYRQQAREQMLSQAQDLGATYIDFEVVETLKGNSTPVITLAGVLEAGDDDGRLPARIASAKARGAFTDPQQRIGWSMVRENITEWGGGMCIEPVRARVGERYLVFRDAEGRLLHLAAADHKPGLKRPLGPITPYVEIPWDGDPWLAAVRKAAAKQGASRRAPVR